MRPLPLLLALIAWLCALTNSSGLAQEVEEDEPFLPGLIAEYLQAGREPIRRLDPVLAANWHDRPDERLLPGKSFSVSWQGMLLVPDDGSYQLHVHGRGDVQVELNGKALIRQEQLSGWASSSVQTLSYGPLPLRVRFTPGAMPAELSLFWSSDRFEREPIPARMLSHDRQQVIETEFDRGRVLSRALRCEACHTDAHSPSATPLNAPALDQLAGNLNREWLVDWLRSAQPHHDPLKETKTPTVERRMPYLSLTKEEADLLADWLLDPATNAKPAPVKVQAKADKAEKKDPKKPVPSREAGEQLLLTQGCIACHRVGEFGESGLFGGGDLTAIAAKRPADFYEKWLQNPAALNRDHRMPVFELTADERRSLALALSARGEGREASAKGKVDHTRARELARKQRCDQCHRLPEEDAVKRVTAPVNLAALSVRSRWALSCAASDQELKAGQADFGLGQADVKALTVYFSQREPSPAKLPLVADGSQLLIENNCLACHAREPQPAGVLPAKFADKLVTVAKAHEDLAPQVPALTPPSLNSVGDKFLDRALQNAITRTGPAHRPYLLVQMPKFRLSKEQTEQLAAYFIDHDRIPDYERTAPATTPQQLEARNLAGQRLVGTDGFSCTSCHQVGSVLPVKAPLNARGPTLSMPQERLRKTWFDRFVHNPARIVPRMEMPSVQTPVRGVLQDNLHEQLAAVWQVLSTPGFEPPLPGPVRTLRFYSSEDNKGKQPLLITDLIEHEGQMLERAALIGLPNRQNILFDFATNRLLAWSQGDFARQRTKGKNWYWEPAGSVLLEMGMQRSEFELDLLGNRYEAVSDGQWLVEPMNWRLHNELLSFEYPLTLRRVDGNPKEQFTVHVKQTIKPYEDVSGRGLTRHWTIDRLPDRARLIIRLVDLQGKQPVVAKQQQGAVRFEARGRGVVLLEHGGKIQTLPDGGMLVSFDRPRALSPVEVWARYRTSLPSDEYHAPRPPPIPYAQPPITIAPGFIGQRLTLPTDIMPTALAWRPNGDLVVASLKGQVLAFQAESLNEPQPTGELLADGLAAPYGIQAGPDYVDVATKVALLRINRNSKSDFSEWLTLASGWGYTADYHDWCVGLPKDEQGNYYVALPCYQDNRSEAAKRLRGSVLKLSPRRPTMDEPLLFGKEVLAHGHRFPMGMALNAKGELFVSDNQGNYNPFNEINQVVPGKHFGFVNKGEKPPESHTEPTISIPHPWTRSVNGICFLNTPKRLAADGRNIFGPLEGHLIGCEYDTRRLIRMSLQKVGDDYQGCCYPLTVQTPAEEAPLGPICCEVSPAGELFIGSIRDSGWGAGNNIGEVIRVKFDASQLGHGLAEMRATSSGFELDFFQPVEEKLAADLSNYSLSSYRRESTPAYGGNDIERRTEKVLKVAIIGDRKRVSLSLDSLRAGHVYELRLKSLAPDGAAFFPAEAHYTLRQLVK